jgi:hypothetical protein
LVTVIATFIVSFGGSENSMAAMSVQLLWLLSAIALHEALSTPILRFQFTKEVFRVANQ